MKIGIANDHSAVDMKNEIVEYLKSLGYEVVNYGTDTYESCNYPEYGEKIGNAVASGEVEQGIAICGTGAGISLTANKVNGIRAVVCSDPYTARMAKEHNDANIIAFGARVIGIETAKCIVDEWLNAKFEGGRHATRVDMIMDVEKRNHNLQNTFLRYRHIMDMEEETADGGLFFQDKKRHAEVV